MPKNSSSSSGDKERELQAERKKKLLCNAIKKVRKRKKERGQWKDRTQSKGIKAGTFCVCFCVCVFLGDVFKMSLEDVDVLLWSTNKEKERERGYDQW